MSDAIIGLLAETFIHSGIGRNEGAIDLPVAREAATDYPFIPGSGVKGAVKAFAMDNGMPDTKHEKCFGVHDDAGSLLVSDARLLLLPVRSLSGSYKWVTCGHLLERFSRDLKRAGLSKYVPSKIPDELQEGQVLGKGEGILFLEERNFKFIEESSEAMLNSLNPLIESL